MRIIKHAYFKKLIVLIIFGIAFGYVEAAVVDYLRRLLDIDSNFSFRHYRVILNLGFIEFVKPTTLYLINKTLSITETAREAATIIMLLSVAYLSGKKFRQRLGAFMVAFATWDIFYYVFLKILLNWPATLFTKDVYFLIPVPWIGPVITPLVCSALLLIGGSWLFLVQPKDKEKV